MNHRLFLLVLMGFMLPSASALTQLTIYVDTVGDALFLGVSDETPVLPEGVFITNGKVNGYTSTLTQKEGEVWTFSYALMSSEMVVVLPERAVIKSISAGDILIEQGRIAVYTINGTTLRYSIEKQDTSNGPGAFITIIGALVALVIVAYLINFKNREKKEPNGSAKEKKTSKLAVISSVLNERENIILKKLETLGKIKMSYLRRVCDMPKASFSRHVHELAKKNLVILSGEGKNKFVELVQENS